MTYNTYNGNDYMILFKMTQESLIIRSTTLPSALFAEDYGKYYIVYIL